MNLIIFILAAIGCTNIIVNEHVTAGIRNLIIKWFPNSLLRILITCTSCMGFWTGIGIALVFPELCIHWFLAGCISSIANKIFTLKFTTF